MKKLSEDRKIALLRRVVSRQRRAALRKLTKKTRSREVADRQAQYKEMLASKGLVARGDMVRRPIILPEVLSFWDNYDETVAAFEEIRRFGLQQHLPLEIRFDNVKQLEPSATLALAAEIYRCQKLRVFRGARFVSGNYPFDATVHAQLRDMGFFKLLEIAEYPGSIPPESVGIRPLYLPFLTDTQVIGAAVDRFVGIIENHLIPLNAAARGKLVGAIKEAMGNVFDHAYKHPTEFHSMQHRWFMSSRVDLVRHEVMVTLYDQGNGIPATLDADLIDRIRAALVGSADVLLHASDGYTIKLATELWRTGTGQSGRGRGFRNMKSFVDICPDGELRVLSNCGYYTYIRGSEHYGDNGISACGTVIQWRFRSDVPLEMIDD
jgi:hypothetical protein